MQVNATDFLNQSGAIQIDRMPDTCPRCHIKQIVIPVNFWRVNLETLQGVFRCSNPECAQVFIGEYKKNVANQIQNLKSLYPFTPKPQEVPAMVAAISPTFVEIMKQVEASKAYKLNQLEGMGLRKALEFLIKDFAIAQNQNDKEGIEKMPLAQVIEKYVDDKQVKRTAKRGVWLGNDETHYTRKWEDKDIRDLHALVTLTIAAINHYLLAAEYEKQMPDK